LISFAFETKVDQLKALPELSDADARKLATNRIEPVFPPGSVEKGTEIVVRISVDETEKLTGAGNPNNLKTAVFLAAYNAVKRWKFQPYLEDGKPQYFHANVVFQAP